MGLLVFLLLVVPMVLGCQEGASCCSEEEINACMSPLLPHTNDFQFSGQNRQTLMVMSALEYLDKTEQLCAQNKLQNAFACLNKLYNLCASQREGAAPMDLLIDVGKWREAMDIICENTDFIRKHQQCERESIWAFNLCYDEHTQRLEAQMSSLNKDSRQTYGAQRTEVISHIACSFTESITQCLKEAYKSNCPDRMVSLLMEVVMKVMPPGCVQKLQQKGYTFEESQESMDNRPTGRNSKDGSFERKEIVVQGLDDRDKDDAKMENSHTKVGKAKTLNAQSGSTGASQAENSQTCHRSTTSVLLGSASLWILLFRYFFHL